MFDYFTNTLITSVLWAGIALTSSALGFSIIEGAVFLKALFYGLSTIPFFFMFKKEINKDVLFMVKSKPKFLLLALLFFMVAGITAEYFYFSAINHSKKKSHIVITITHTLPVVLVALGAHFLLGEKINKETLIGMIFVIIGIVIMKMFGHKCDLNKN